MEKIDLIGYCFALGWFSSYLISKLLDNFWISLPIFVVYATVVNVLFNEYININSAIKD